MIAGSALATGPALKPGIVRKSRSSLIGRAGSGWQYLLADLSLILFMVTAAALASAEDAPAKPAKAAVAARQDGASPVSAQGEVLALYRAAPGAPPLRQWLHDQSADARQQLTIVAQYRTGEQAQAMSQAAALAQDAGDAGLRARIVIEPGQGGTTAALAFDAPVSATSVAQAPSATHPQS